MTKRVFKTNAIMAEPKNKQGKQSHSVMRIPGLQLRFMSPYGRGRSGEWRGWWVWRRMGFRL